MFVIDSGNERNGETKSREYALDEVVLKVVGFIEPGIENDYMQNLCDLDYQARYLHVGVEYQEFIYSRVEFFTPTEYVVKVVRYLFEGRCGFFIARVFALISGHGNEEYL